MEPRRYKAAYGGRGSGKSHFFAGLAVRRAFAEPGLRIVCIREVQKDLSESAKRLIEDKIQSYNLGPHFDCQRHQIVTPGNGVIIFEGMQDHNAESIKSLEGFDVAWVEEAQTLSLSSLTMLRPTLRKDSSELWFSWNPRRKTDAVDDFFRGPAGAPVRSTVVRANWSDNPWFNAELVEERREDMAKRPEQCDHIWEGGYATVLSGAYFARDITQARADKRIGRVSKDPLMPIKAFWDLGIKDATAIWIGQFIGREIRILDYYEAVNQPLGTHLEWLRSKGYGSAHCYLPHDGEHPDTVQAVKFEDHIRAAGFEVTTVKNQGKGAAMKRVEAARRLFPSCWFNEQTTTPGLDALGWYHEKKDEKRNVGLGPEHDWSSHAADAFGLMCIAYETPTKVVLEPVRYGPGGWMG